MANDECVASVHPWGKRHDLHALFQRFGRCVVRVQVELPDGSIGNGTAFHIGGGAFATAAHVVRGYSHQTLYQGDTRREDLGWPVSGILYHTDPKVDVAILVSDLWMARPVTHENQPEQEEAHSSHIEIPEMWGEWIEDCRVLTRGLICGYPTVPCSDGSYKFAVSAEINSDSQRFDVPSVHFVVSSAARGGFSDSPFISEFGMLVAIVTDALFNRSGMHPYMAVRH